jgi:hypothetical protein
MSIGPTAGLLASVAGVPLAQTQGAEIDRAKNEVSSYQRARQSERKAENAAGIGATDGENHDTNERDADGRRPWELDAVKKSSSADDEAAAPDFPRASRDAADASGNQLDLTA